MEYLPSEKVTKEHITALQTLMLSSLQEFTCIMFELMQKKPYIVGEHHKLICNALDKVIQGKTKKLIINIAPRYGKTLLVSQMFIAQGFAINPKSLFLHLSYSDSLVAENSMAVKDILSNEYFQAFFPARIKAGANTKSKWETIQGGGEYAVSTLGQVTGFGAGRVENEDAVIDEFTQRFNPDGFSGAIVIDDAIKPEDAFSDSKREAVNRRFETTIRSRVNSRNTPIIIIMQRLHEHDLCGYLQEVEPDEWEVLSLPCITRDEQGNEKALWEFKHTLEELHKKQMVDSVVFETQYMQNPRPFEGLLYREFDTYDIEEIADGKGNASCYIDSADTGSDYLCAIFYRERKDANYITDVIFTKKPMEVTEPMVAKALERNKTKVCFIESNNGGRIFRRNVERLSREAGNMSVRFVDKTQRENKMVRLYSKANEVNNSTRFPKGWKTMFPEFAGHITSFRREGNNLHDDGADALTGTYEMRGKGTLDLEAIRKSLL